MHTKGGEHKSCVGRVCIEPIAEETIDSIAAEGKKLEIEYEKRLLRSRHNRSGDQKPEAEPTLAEALHDLKTEADTLSQSFDRAAAAQDDEGASLSPRDMESLVSGLLELRLKIERVSDRNSAAPDPTATAMLEAAKGFTDGALDKLKDLPDDAPVPSAGARDQPLPYFMRHEVGPLLALEIRARQSANGETVLRPAGYQRALGDQWDVDFEVRTLGREKGREQYEALRCVRSRLLREEEWYERYYRTSFMRHIAYLSERGRSWREALDGLDHKREQVVFKPHEG
jgi:hypothetical protein